MGVAAAGAGVAVVVVDKVEEGLQLDMEMHEADSFLVERKITEWVITRMFEIYWMVDGWTILTESLDHLLFAI